MDWYFSFSPHIQAELPTFRLFCEEACLNSGSACKEAIPRFCAFQGARVGVGYYLSALLELNVGMRAPPSLLVVDILNIATRIGPIQRVTKDFELLGGGERK